MGIRRGTGRNRAVYDCRQRMTSSSEQCCRPRLSAILFGLSQAPPVASGSNEHCSRTSTRAEAFWSRTQEHNAFVTRKSEVAVSQQPALAVPR
jgi:hypothetical protein